ncbi:restriction endonuclease subunit S, partial [Paramuribaculum intestinale]|uniref:restriction endonuclease subunit S n=1 Tax=Paramuribaculum intestinale TaxID=2094151 RepID=UPI0025B6C2F0
MDTQKLRQRILDLAIRGKLVPQDPNDEPASVLLERIRAEKERLIAEGKLKRPKAKKSTDKSHYQNFTPPFDIPDSWEWVRLGDVCDVARGGSPRPIKSYLTYRVDGINWIKIGDTEKDGKFINSTKERIIPEGALKSRLVHKGDFLLTNSMSFGRPYILNIDGCIHDGWLVISPIGNVFDKDFLYLLLSSEYAYYQFSEKASGSAVSNLNSDKVAESIFPLPPLETQRIIVRECEKLTSFAQTIDNEKKDLEITIALTKSKILDLAMQGKLVPQDPADEPATDMLRRINPKAKIITDNPQCRNLPLGWTL